MPAWAGFHASLGIPAADHTALWKLPQLWKSNKEAFGNVFLMISTAAWKSLAKNTLGFPTVPTAPTAITTNSKTKGNNFFSGG